MSERYGPSPTTSTESKSKSDNAIIGPTLPPHLLKNQSPSQAKSTVIGPTLPPHLLNKSDSSSLHDSDEDNSSPFNIGPTLPSHLMNTDKNECSQVGPTLPPHLQNKDTTATSSTENEISVLPQLPESDTIQENQCDSSSDAFGPALPPHLQRSRVREDSDDDDVYGPLPAGVSSTSQAHRALEERALQMKLNSLDAKDEKATVREEWMIELPDVGASRIGLGPRQFRKNQKPDFSDRSSWTDTPEQKAKKQKGGTEVKVDLKQEAELRELHKRDEEQAKIAEKHNKKRKKDKSLLELHQDKIKKKKKEEEEEGLPTRRPFNREIDLKVNQFDDAQKKSIMKKAMHLDDRFSRGQSKFL